MLSVPTDKGEELDFFGAVTSCGVSSATPAGCLDSDKLRTLSSYPHPSMSAIDVIANLEEPFQCVARA